VRDLPRALRGYLWAIYLAAALVAAVQGRVFVAWGPLAPGHAPLLLAAALVVLLAYLGERTTIQVTAAFGESLNSAVYLAALLLLPLPLPLLIALPATLAEQLWHARTPPYKRAFNVAHSILVVGLGDTLLTRLAAPTAPTALLRPGHLAAAVPVLLPFLLLFYALDSAPLLGVLALLERRVPWRVWWEGPRLAAPVEVAASTVGLLAAIAWRFDPLALALLFVPIVALHGSVRTLARAVAAEEREALAVAQAAHDGLTGLLTHRAFQTRLEEEIARSERSGRPLALVMIDLDDFRAVNNTHGHQAGDAVLVAIATAIRASIRTADSAGRYGGDEFAAILPEADLIEALAVAARTCAAVAAVTVEARCATIRVGASLGVAVAPLHAGTRTELIAAADAAAYDAKGAGKGCVQCATTASGVTPLRRTQPG